MYKQLVLQWTLNIELPNAGYLSVLVVFSLGSVIVFMGAALRPRSEAQHGCCCTNPKQDPCPATWNLLDIKEVGSLVWTLGSRNTLAECSSHHMGSLWWGWETLLSAVLGLCLNSKTPASPVYKPYRFIAQWQLLIKKKSCYALWSVGVFYLFMSVVVSFLLSVREKGSKIIQITLSLLMRSSAKHVLVFPSLWSGCLQNRNRKWVSNP